MTHHNPPPFPRDVKDPALFKVMFEAWLAYWDDANPSQPMRRSYYGSYEEQHRIRKEDVL